jgi:hypothetical protein
MPAVILALLFCVAAVGALAMVAIPVGSWELHGGARRYRRLAPPGSRASLREMTRKSQLGAQVLFKARIDDLFWSFLTLVKYPTYDYVSTTELRTQRFVREEGRALLLMANGPEEGRVEVATGLLITVPPKIETAALGRLVHIRAVVRSEGDEGARSRLAVSYATGRGNSGLRWFDIPLGWSMVETSWLVPKLEGERALIALMPGPPGTREILVRQVTLAIDQAAAGQSAAPAAAGLQGAVDYFGPSRVAGWAWNAADPNARLLVTIEIDGHEVTTVVADRVRPDLLAAGKGDGAHSFSVELPGTGPASDTSLRCIVAEYDFVLRIPRAATRRE